ncbi:hypothetical protein THAOC_05804, partial [Thalassiosira oceanica]
SELPPPASSIIVSNESSSPASASIDEKRDRRASFPARVATETSSASSGSVFFQAARVPVSLGLARLGLACLCKTNSQRATTRALHPIKLYPWASAIEMSELDHLRKKPPDGGLLLKGVSRVQEKRQRLAEKGGERTETAGAREARLKADRANKESKREAETEDAWTLRLQDQARRQDLLRQTETEDAHDARLQADRAYKESKREAETKDARISRLQGQAQRQQCRLQNEAQQKKASRAMSPVRSQNSSDSDAVMEDVDSSSSDESSDESMNDNVQMTSDTSKAIQN